MTAPEIAETLEAKPAGDGWVARCPAHEDHRASLSLTAGDDGRVLLHCHAGCPVDAIVSALGLTTSDLFASDTRTTTTTTKPKIVATYDYEAEHDTLLCQAVRYEPKDFRQRRPDGKGGWVWNMKGVNRVLYLLPDLRGRIERPEYRREHNLPDDVFVVEGEKDADRLWRQGLLATTNIGGAGKWRDEYTQQLVAAGVKSVVVLPDNDDPGRQHAEQVAASCHAAGLTVKVVMLPNLPPKGDVSDWLTREGHGQTVESLVSLAEASPVYSPTPAIVKVEKSSKTKPEKPKQGRDVQFNEAEPWSEPVAGGVLVQAIADTFSRYLALPQHANIALALWVLHAYTFEAWFVSPFLAITSPEKRCGKTLLLIVVGALVPRRMFASNVTPAVLFRAIEKYKPTLLIDEADTFVRDNEELRGVLNSGHTRTTATVIRAVGDDHDPRAFSTWCAKAIALIGRLPGTLDDRSIEIRMRRRTPGEHVARLRQDRIDDECAVLRRQAVRWADDDLHLLQAADPQVPAALHDRAADCWRPLLAIADRIGGDWPARAREAALALSGAPAEDAASTRLLRDIRDVFAEADDPEVLASKVIIEQLVAVEDAPWGEWSKGKPLSTAKLARLLKDYDIYPAGTVRIGPTETAKGYRRVAFVEAWDRYLGVLNPSQRNNPNKYGAESLFSNRHNQNECDGLESVTNPMNTEHCDAVTLPTPPEHEEEIDGLF
jgi:hypothetical protein